MLVRGDALLGVKVPGPSDSMTNFCRVSNQPVRQVNIDQSKWLIGAARDSKT